MKINNEQARCPYCRGVKRIRNDLVHYTKRRIIQIKHGNQLYAKFIYPNREDEVMAYIRFCPMCGRNLMEEK
ncbi:hypothetical protein [uncultured Lactobacillus sp.]|uniref:hypothetical protein n=1 Tax=uncultured Lactobacillus sp. TaxID=153152 RepID=UPI0026282382|nr:hypothetical protein [uncultured Lactobacillus sp.]